MSRRESDDAAREAAQHVADEVKSWHHGATEDTIREALDTGLDQAQVEIPEQDTDRLVDEIKGDGPAPEVPEATARD